MSDATMLLTGPVGRSIGWALVHLTWQAAIVAVSLTVAIRALRGAAASTRYAVAVAALGLTLLLPIVTAVRAYDAIDRGAAVPAVFTSTSMTPVEASGVASLPVATVSQSRIEVERSLPWIVIAWLFGVIALSIRLAFQWWGTRSLVRSSTFEIDRKWERMTDHLARRLNLGSLIRLAQSAAVEVPTVVGWLRPVILMPVSALSGLTPEQIETILAHEIAHIRRQDYLVNLVQTAIETLLFYHPGVWWISRQIRIERENCCDDLAVEICGDPVVYARALTVLEQMRANLPGTAIASNGGSLLERIRRLVGRTDSRDDRSIPAAGIAIAGAALAVLLFVTPMALAAKQNHDRKTKPKSPHYEMTVTSNHGASSSANPVVSVGADTEAPTPPEPPEVPAPPEAPPAPTIPATVGIAAPPAVPSPPSIPAPPAPPAPPSIPAITGIHLDTGFVEATSTAIADAVVEGVTGAFANWAESDDTAPGAGSRASDKPLDPDHLSVDELIRLRDMEITPEYIRGVRGLGYPDASLRDFTRLAGVGATIPWIREMRTLFGPKITIRQLVRLRVVGATTEYVEEMKKAGFTTSVDDVVRLRALGVTADFASRMRKVGVTQPDTIIRMRAMGVTPETVTSARSTWPHATDEEIVRMRALGVTPDDLAAWKAHGFEGLSLDDLVRLRSLDVTPEYADSLAAAGFKSLKADELVRLKAIGVTADYVRELRAAGLENLTPDEAIRLKARGVDAGFLRGLKDSNK